MTRNSLQTQLSCVSAGCPQAVYITAQVLPSGTALKVKLADQNLRWSSQPLSCSVFPLCLGLVFTDFLLIACWSLYLLQTILLDIIPPPLCDETVNVLSVFLVSVTVSHCEKRTSIAVASQILNCKSVFVILRASFITVHGCLSLFVFHFMVWIYRFPVFKQVDHKVSFLLLDKLVYFYLKLDSKLYNSFLSVLHQH